MAAATIANSSPTPSLNLDHNTLSLCIHATVVQGAHVLLETAQITRHLSAIEAYYNLDRHGVR